MSRTFSKILVICALVVILPLTIVGTAFAAYYSVDAVVNITVQLIDDAKADPNSNDAFAGVRYGGEDIAYYVKDTVKNTCQIAKSHLETVTVEARNVGYDFVGWFEGDEYTEEMQDQDNLADGNKLTFKMEDGKSYVAVFKVIKYQLSWHYMVDPEDNMGSGTYTSEDPDKENHPTSEYVYGSALKTLSNEKAHGYKVSEDGGWCVYKEGQPVLNKHYNRAEFKDSYGKDFGESDRDIQLTYNWIEEEKFTINYYNVNDRLNPSKVAIATDEVVKNETSSYVYASKFASLKVTEAERGYKWGGENGFKRIKNNVLESVTEDDFTGGDFTDSVDVYVECIPVEYTAKLIDGEGATFGGTQITFDVTDIDNAETKFGAFLTESNYEKEHFFYEFKGIKVGAGETISSTNIDGLKNALNTFVDAHKNEDATIEFTSEFETNYTITISQNVKYGYTVNDAPVYNERGTEVVDRKLDDNVAVTTTLEEYLKISGTTFYNADASHTRDEVTFTKIAFGSQTIKGLTKDSTVAEFIDKLNADSTLKRFLSIDNATHKITVNYAILVVFEKTVTP